MTKLERVQAALKRAAHRSAALRLLAPFPRRRPLAAALAQSTLRFHERYRLGLPQGHARPAATRWRTGAAWRATRSPPTATGPAPATRSTSPEDWKKIRPVAPGVDTAWALAPRDHPPLRRGPARRLLRRCRPSSARSRWRASCRASGSTTTSRRTRRPSPTPSRRSPRRSSTFADACFREGAEGIFYSVQAASTDLHTEEEYRRFGEPYDRRILERVRPKSKLTILHCHGANLMFDRPRGPARPCLELGRPPRRAVAARDAQRARARRGHRRARPVGRAQGRDPEAARAEAQDALAQTGGRGVILGAGCVLPSQTSDLALVERDRSPSAAR